MNVKANKPPGLGLGFVTHYLSLPDHTVIASVRNPHDANSKALSLLPVGESSKLILISIESASSSSALDAISGLKSIHGIEHLDIVIANAGIANVCPRVQDALPSDMLHHYEINVVGPVLLFQAVLPLLKKDAMFISMGSSAGSLAAMEYIPISNSAYGPTKTALGWVTRKMHFEHEELVVFVMDPGWVQTDLGNAGARAFGMKEATLPLDVSIQGMVKVIANATRDNSGGKFMNYDGSQSAW